jgi:hypothetical protein
MNDTDPERTESGECVERSFTCSACGFPMTHEAGTLQAEVRSICHNCGDWTLQTADESTVVQATEDVAEGLAGEVLTERQALAYLLREVVGLEREAVAAAMDSSPSNVDNLRRRATERVDDATRVVDELEALRGGEE